MTVITGVRAGSPASRISRWRDKAMAAIKTGKQVFATARARYHSSVMTIAGLACIDTAAWHVNAGLGWLAIGVSVLLYDAFGGEKP